MIKINMFFTIETFNYYLSVGMKLVAIQRILRFKQSDGLKKYIDFNTRKRNYHVNRFKKDFLKLMKNSAHDKRMENLRKRIKIRLVNSARDYKKWVSRPSFLS